MEMYAFFGLTLFAGIFGTNVQPSHELWGHNGNPIYRATMSATRYKLILKYIRFDNGSTRSARLVEGKSAAIDDVWNMLMNNVKPRYVPCAQITVDEQLFPYRGRTRFTQYIYIYIIETSQIRHTNMVGVRFQLKLSNKRHYLCWKTTKRSACGKPWRVRCSQIGGKV